MLLRKLYWQKAKTRYIEWSKLQSRLQNLTQHKNVYIEYLILRISLKEFLHLPTLNKSKNIEII